MTEPTGEPDAATGGKALAPAHVEWLSLIWYQSRQADEQSRAPLPLAILSINIMQDAVEGVLHLIAEHNDIELRKRSDFDKLFDDVAKRFPSLAHHRAPLLALNTARVGFKHHGNEVRETTIERHRGNAMDFLTDAALVGLSQDFEAISSIAFVRDAEARGHLEDAAAAWATADASGALGNLRLAFDRLVRDYEKRKIWSPGRSVFSTEPSFRPRGSRASRDETAAHLVKWLEAIDERQKLLAFGVDLRRYAYLDVYAPTASYSIDGNVFMRVRDTGPITGEVYSRCYRFVLDTALRLGADDYNFDAWAIQKARQEESAG